MSGLDPTGMVGGPGPVPGGIRPSRPHEGAPCTQGAPGRKTGSILAPPIEVGPASGPCRATASNLDTLLDRGVGRRVRMLLSFQRPSHLFGRGAPSYRRVGTGTRSRADS